MKATPSHPHATAPLPCFECAKGQLLPIREDYATLLPSGRKVTVPDVAMLRCDHCGDTVIGDEGNQKIDAWLSKLTNAITPQEIADLLSKYSLTQKEASTITGLGEKNISRWLTGRTRPSESVSNFLRLLLADRTAFERLLYRNFTDAPQPTGTRKDRSNRSSAGTTKAKAIA
jgi:putative zinc finger/helix-turn-helix YgiT family protein